MKAYIYGFLVLLFVGLGVSTTILFNSWQKERSERIRVSENFDIVQSKYTTEQSHSNEWKDKLGRSVSKTRKLVLTIDELKKYREADAKTIKDLKLKHPTDAGTIGTQTTVPFTATVRDSIIRDTLRPCIDFKDNYAQINGCIDANKTFVGTFSVKDTIRTFGSVTYRKWLLFRCKLFGIESIRQTVISSSPYTKISYNEFIILE